jgi:hypothetical protein
MWRYLLAWLPMVAIAIGNGVIREAGYGPHLSELAAHQASTATAVLLLGLYMWFVIGRWPPRSVGQAVAVGFLWLLLTVGFEFLFGGYVRGLDWARLLRDYDVSSGRVWLVVPLWVAAAPYLFYRLRHH